MKWNKLLLVALAAILCTALSHALAEESAVFRLPASLRIIEEGAFEETAPSAVYLPDSLEYIGDRAFAQTEDLTVAYIPRSVRYIGEDAFAGHDGLVIVGIPGSYAEGWAKRHGYKFVYMDVWAEEQTSHGRVYRRCERLVSYAQPQPGLMTGMALFFILCFLFFSPDPKDRPEYFPIMYDFP